MKIYKGSEKMRKNNAIFLKNEFEANVFTANVMRISCLFVVVAQLLNYLGVFIIEEPTMLLSSITGIIILLIPTVLVDIMKIKKTYIKYIILLNSFFFLLYINLLISTKN